MKNLLDTMPELPARDDRSLRAWLDGCKMVVQHEVGAAAGTWDEAAQTDRFAQELRDVPAGPPKAPKRHHKPRRRDVGSANRLAGALETINEIVRQPAISWWLPGLLGGLTAHGRTRAFVERILREPADQRGALLMPPWTTDPSLWARVLEIVAAVLVVDDLAERHGDEHWPRIALRGLSDGLPVGPPFRTPRWFPASYEPVRRLARMLLDLPLDLLRRIRRCQYNDCWMKPHSCPLSPYFMDLSQSVSKLTCCPAHRTALSRARNSSSKETESPKL